ncbi:hypothetical protein MRS76_11825 [Rhizobiaceae bacterium n13]|uniref:Uncharacterized protein n=1 Tax=Ferirhizobium litorale TaxID=2927786 RepID=A0AAE3QIM8_9HYPH|nr:hypothetical protein [Fererhizobium litorale]MDI7862648.1 hypothetical protein [Fererhizobium litorale]MDI7923869.1 hypothetical protein [Fererhizobium litorale]
MSSRSSKDLLSLSELETIASVLGSSGYSAAVLVRDPQLFNAAALLVNKLFAAGVTSPHELSRQLDRQFGKASQNMLLYSSPHARFAIQGLPNLSPNLRMPVS